MNEATQASAPVFKYSKQILEHHLDTFGHVNNATYLQIYEEARWDFIEKNGFGLAYILKEKFGPVILQANLSFRKELINREVIVIESQFRTMKNKLVMIMDQKMIKPDGQIASIIELHVGLMDLKERKLIVPTTPWLAAVGAPEISQKVQKVTDTI